MFPTDPCRTFVKSTRSAWRLSNWRDTIVLFFVFSFFALPCNSKVFPFFQEDDALRADSANASDLTQNDDRANSSESGDCNDSVSTPRWFKLERDGKTPIGLDTSIVRFQGEYVANDGVKRDVSVDLVGAIHFAEKEYYDELNAAFREYETVVFELVAPEGADIRQLIREERAQKKELTASPLNFLAFAQEKAGKALGFVYQIDGIDYLASNLRRGDCDSKEFLLKLLTNGDVSNFFVDTFYSSLLSGDVSETIGYQAVVALLCAKDRRLVLRRIVALELEESSFEEVEEETRLLETSDTNDRGGDSLDEKKRENILIHYRNKKALDVARQELAAGRVKIAIFYGAAHLPDLGKRLETEFKLQRDPQTRWLRAWNMEPTK